MFHFLKKHISKENNSFLQENEKQKISVKEEKYILLQDFDLLNALLEQKHRCVQMVITNYGTNKYQYEVTDYKLDYRNKTLWLNLKLDENYQFEYIIEAIDAIQTVASKDGIHVLISYHHVYLLNNEKKVIQKTIPIIFLDKEVPTITTRCNTKSYEREEKEYEQYEFTDRLKYYVGEAIYDCTVRQGIKVLDEKYYRLKHKGDKYCLLLLERDSNYDVFYVDDHGWKSVVYFELVENDELYIVDVTPLYFNEGIGTNAFNLLFNYIAQTNTIKKIYGRTSPIDDNHADRRKHFFNKLGFTIEGRKVSRKF